MAIEIFILSGSRRGQRLTLDAVQFRAGCDPECELRFDPELDPGARNKAVLLRLENDGWHITPISSGDLRVNQQMAAGPTRLRSGDVIGLSASGPEFCFRVESRGRDILPPVMAAAVPQATRSLLMSPPTTPAAAAEPHTGEARDVPRPAALAAPPSGQWNKWAIGGVAACILLVLAWRASADGARCDSTSLNYSTAPKSEFTAAKSESKAVGASYETVRGPREVVGA